MSRLTSAAKVAALGKGSASWVAGAKRALERDSATPLSNNGINKLKTCEWRTLALTCLLIAKFAMDLRQ